jgi:hypothetical protein
MSLSSVKQSGCDPVPPATMQEILHCALHVVVNNSFGLVVEMFNISEFEVTNTIMGKHLSGLLFKK